MEICDRNTDMYIFNTSLIAHRNFNKHSNTGYCPVDSLVPLTRSFNLPPTAPMGGGTQLFEEAHLRIMLNTQY